MSQQARSRSNNDESRTITFASQDIASWDLFMRVQPASLLTFLCTLLGGGNKEADTESEGEKKF